MNLTTTTTSTTIKPPEIETEKPSQTQQTTKSLSFTNGVLKRHHHPTVVVTYKECLKNHAASLGGHALDGCGEFMPSPSAIPTDPTSLKCAACGCHRNFHRRDPDEGTQIIDYQPPPPPPPPHRGRSPSSASPPPLSSSYYPSAPHMLLALSAGVSGPSNNHPTVNTTTHPTTPTTGTTIANRNGRKRFRTKFSPEQKEKMHLFSERLGWKIQKRDESLVEEFCNEVGIGKGVLKVWMHNNKNSLGKIRDGNSSRSSIDTGNNNNNNHHNNNSDGNAHVATNGSTSSS